MRGLVAGSIALVLIFAASAAPIPLYSQYCAMLGVPKSAFSIATVAYFVGTIGSLLVFARLSNFIGRKRAILIATAFSIAGCLSFALIANEALLYFGRFVQGLACGIASGSAGAYVVDNAPEKPAWLSAVITTSGPQAGLTIGCLLSAAFADAEDLEAQWAFFLLIGAFVACAAFVCACPETVKRYKGAIRSMEPSVRVPASVKAVLHASCFAFMGTWAIGGFYQASSTVFSQICFSSSSTLIAAAVFALFMAPSVIGAPLASKLTPERAQVFGMGAFVCSVACLACAVLLANPALLIVASICGGITQGVAYSGGMRRVLARTAPSESASILSMVTMVSYTGAAVPNLIIGTAGASWSTPGIACGYAIAVALCFAGSALVLRKQAFGHSGGAG